VTCSDCRRPSVVLVTTWYGLRYCRPCLRPPPLHLALPAPNVKSHTLKQSGKRARWAA
jgi:hypothetical protein